MWRYFVASCMVEATSKRSMCNSCPEKVFWLREIWFGGFVLFYFWTVIVLSHWYLGSVGLKMLYGQACKQLASADTKRLCLLWLKETDYFFEIPVVLGAVVIYIPPTTKSSFSFSSHTEDNSPINSSCTCVQLLANGWEKNKTAWKCWAAQWLV